MLPRLTDGTLPAGCSTSVAAPTGRRRLSLSSQMPRTILLVAHKVHIPSEQKISEMFNIMEGFSQAGIYRELDGSKAAFDLPCPAPRVSTLRLDCIPPQRGHYPAAQPTASFCHIATAERWLNERTSDTTRNVSERTLPFYRMIQLFGIFDVCRCIKKRQTFYTRIYDVCANVFIY